MELEEENSKLSTVAPLFQVTQLSKYLALILFILMPFIGGLIGYTFAPEKVVEYERLIIKDSDNDLKRDSDFELNRSDYSYQPTYIPSQSIAEIDALQSEFVDVEKLLKMASFEWHESDTFRDYQLLRFDTTLAGSSTSSCLNGNLVDCWDITLIGDTYSNRVLYTDSGGDSLNDFDISQISDYLESQNYVLVTEVRKNWQFGEYYQKVLDDTVQIISISALPINLVFSDDEVHATSQGTEYRIFVSSVFEMPTN